ncbi:MAG: helix-turn-helix transcriptional regulator [Actinomycetota bacterium]
MNTLTAAERVREARKQEGWTQAELTRRAHINSIGLVSMIESGYRPGARLQGKLAAALGLDPAALFPVEDSD